MKRKIGMTLEKDVYDQLKQRADDAHQPITDVIQTAVMDYLHQPNSRVLPKPGLQRFLARKPFKLSPRQFKENMDADFYNQ